MSATSNCHEEERTSAGKQVEKAQRTAAHPFAAEHAGTCEPYACNSMRDTRLNTRPNAAARSLMIQQAQKIHGNRAVQRACRSAAVGQLAPAHEKGSGLRRLAVQRFPQLPLIAHDLMQEQEEMPRGGGGGILGAASGLLGAIPGVAPLMSGAGALVGGGLQTLFGGFGRSEKEGPQRGIDAQGPVGSAGTAAPRAPGPNASEEEIARYRMEMQKYSRMFEMLSNIMNSQHDMKKSLMEKLR